MQYLPVCLQLRDTPVVLVGGGYIGMEVAATARGRGCQVTVVELQARRLIQSWKSSWQSTAAPGSSPATPRLTCTAGNWQWPPPPTGP